MGSLKRIGIAFFLLSSVGMAVDGSVSGIVTDPSGAVIANAPVSITNLETPEEDRTEIRTSR